MGFKAVYSHQPDLSNLMIYEQNDKTILLLKSSIGAFEGEIDYYFQKGAYKTPEEFNELVIQHFQKNCFVIANGEALKITNIQVQLGHETTLFAELENVPEAINSIFISNTVFKDMPNNQCELILSIKGLPQKQYILDNGNRQEVNLKVENNKWVVNEAAKESDLSPGFLIGSAVLLAVSIIAIAVKKGKRRSAI